MSDTFALSAIAVLSIIAACLIAAMFHELRRTLRFVERMERADAIARSMQARRGVR